MLEMDWFVKKIGEIRDNDVKLQRKFNIGEEKTNQFFYLEGRIGALSDVLLEYYFRGGK